MLQKAVIVGSGSRGIYMFASPILKDFKETTVLSAYYDTNLLRAKAANTILKTDLPVYKDFELMMKEINPDILVVTSKDSTHAEYIIKGLE